MNTHVKAHDHVLIHMFSDNRGEFNCENGGQIKTQNGITGLSNKNFIFPKIISNRKKCTRFGWARAPGSRIFE